MKKFIQIIFKFQIKWQNAFFKKLPKLTQKEMENLNSLLSIKAIVSEI